MSNFIQLFINIHWVWSVPCLQVSDTTFRLPEELIIKAAYSFRVAVVSLNGTSAFSNSSKLYQTNSEWQPEHWAIVYMFKKILKITTANSSVNL